jgi:hypothetical protein
MLSELAETNLLPGRIIPLLAHQNEEVLPFNPHRGRNEKGYFSSSPRQQDGSPSWRSPDKAAVSRAWPSVGPPHHGTLEPSNGMTAKGWGFVHCRRPHHLPPGTRTVEAGACVGVDYMSTHLAATWRSIQTGLVTNASMGSPSARPAEL